MHKRMGEAVARVARKVNDTVENKKDSLDLANCKLMTFPVGVYKAMRSVTEGIHRISLANNELKSITSRFVTTFSQLPLSGARASSVRTPLGWGKETHRAKEINFHFLDSTTSPEGKKMTLFPSKGFAPSVSQSLQQ
uniref:Leucine rich repeat containing 20 n=1 Tax=Zosterops lateralis melanops TaxID=1220523 RepID=A0A8D2NTH3_ZOSLA